MHSLSVVKMETEEASNECPTKTRGHQMAQNLKPRDLKSPLESQNRFITSSKSHSQLLVFVFMRFLSEIAPKLAD